MLEIRPDNHSRSLVILIRPTMQQAEQPLAARLKRVVTLGREFNVQMGVFASLAVRPGCTELELIAEKIVKNSTSCSQAIRSALDSRYLTRG
jgi:hypothetical protein